MLLLIQSKYLENGEHQFPLPWDIWELPQFKQETIASALLGSFLVYHWPLLNFFRQSKGDSTRDAYRYILVAIASHLQHAIRWRVISISKQLNCYDIISESHPPILQKKPCLLSEEISYALMVTFKKRTFCVEKEA